MIKILSINISKKKGEVKKEINIGNLISGFGLKGDAHAGDWHRQVSLLSYESIEKMKKNNPKIIFNNGDFAENIITKGIDLKKIPIGTEFKIGDKAILKVTQIGKECHFGCKIKQKIGYCIMPKEGIFAKILLGGIIKKNDKVTFFKNNNKYSNNKYSFGVLTVSDSCFKNKKEDLSREVIKTNIENNIGKKLYLDSYNIVPDDNKIEENLKKWIYERNINLIFTTGGTGFSDRDVTPDVTKKIIDKNIPGIPEIMRIGTLKYNKYSILSRGVAGIKNKTLIINLPGNSFACKECINSIYHILEHSLDILNEKIKLHI